MLRTFSRRARDSWTALSTKSPALKLCIFGVVGCCLILVAHHLVGGHAQQVRSCGLVPVLHPAACAIVFFLASPLDNAIVVENVYQALNACIMIAVEWLWKATSAAAYTSPAARGRPVKDTPSWCCTSTTTPSNLCTSGAG